MTTTRSMSKMKGRAGASKGARNAKKSKSSRPTTIPIDTEHETIIVSDDEEESASFPFLKLPLEIRRMVFCLLLAAPSTVALEDSADFDLSQEKEWLRPAWYKTSRLVSTSRCYCEPCQCRAVWTEEPLNSFHTEILSTNRQIYQEAQCIFYGENTFGFSILQENLFDGYDPIAEDDSSIYDLQAGAEDYGYIPGTLVHTDVPFGNIRKWELLVEVTPMGPEGDESGEELEDDEYDHSAPIARAIRKFSTYLAARPPVLSLKVRFSTPCTSGEHKILQYLGLLRNVQNVDFEVAAIGDHYGKEVSAFAQNLKTLIQSNEPVVHLPKMYLTLESFALPYAVLDAKITFLAARIPEPTTVWKHKYEASIYQCNEPHIVRAAIKWHKEKQGEKQMSLKGLLDDARAAMEEFDVPKFKAIREVIVEAAITQVADTARGVFTQDGNEGDGAGQRKDVVSKLRAAVIAWRG